MSTSWPGAAPSYWRVLDVGAGGLRAENRLCLKTLGQKLMIFSKCLKTSRRCLQTWRKSLVTWRLCLFTLRHGLETLRRCLMIFFQSLQTLGVCLQTPWQCLEILPRCLETLRQCLWTRRKRITTFRPPRAVPGLPRGLLRGRPVVAREALSQGRSVSADFPEVVHSCRRGLSEPPASHPALPTILRRRHAARSRETRPLF